MPDRRVIEAAQTRTTVGLPAGIELRSMTGSSITAIAPPYSRGHGGNDDGYTFAFGGPNQLRDSVDGASGSGGVNADDRARAHTSHHHHHEHHHRHDHHYSSQRQQDHSQAEMSQTKLIPRKQVPKQSQNDTTQAGPSQTTSAVEPQPQHESQSQEQPTIPFHEDDNNQKENLPTPADYAALSAQHNASSDADSNEQVQTGNKQASGEDSQAEFHYRQRQHGSQTAQLVYPERDNNITNNDNEDTHSETEAEIEREFNPRYRPAQTPDHHAAGKKTAQNSLGYAKHRNGGPPSTPPKGPAYLADLTAADDGSSAKTIRLVQPSLQHRPLPSIPSALAAGEDAGAHDTSHTAAAGEAPALSSTFEREMSPPGAYPLTPAVHTWNDENTRRIPVLPHSDVETDAEDGDEVSLLLPAAATPAPGESATPFKKASSAPATPYSAQNVDHYYTPVSDEEEGDSYRFTATPSWVSTISTDRSHLGSPIVSSQGSPDNLHSHTPQGNPDVAATAAYSGLQSPSSPLSTTTSAARYDAYSSIDPTDHESIKSRLSEERDRVLERLAVARSRSSSPAGSPDALRRDNSGTATSITGPATTAVGQVGGLLHDRRPSQTSTFSAFSFSHTPPSMTRQDRGNQATAAPDSPLAGRSRSGAAANQTGHAGEAGNGGGGVVSSIFGSLLGRSGTKHQRNEQSKDADN